VTILKKLSPIDRLATLLVLSGLVALLVFVASDALDGWAPNVATEAWSIALTIVVVERIVRGENERRVRPRVERAKYLLSNAFLEFGRHAYMDYLSTHLKVAQKDIPTDAVELLKFWREKMDPIDSPRRPQSDGRTWFLNDALKFVQKTQRVVDSDRELLPPNLVVTIDNLNVIMGGLSETVAELADDVPDRPGLDGWLLLVIVSGAETFGTELRKWDNRSFALFGSSRD
jgi:hypothetical protein